LESYEASKTLKLFLENCTPGNLLATPTTLAAVVVMRQTKSTETVGNYVMRREKDAMEGKAIIARTAVARITIERGNKQFC
jgi:hypothetical protein